MSSSLKIYWFVKVISFVAFLMIGFASTKCSSESQPVETSSQVELTLDEEDNKLSLIAPKDFVSPSGSEEGTDQWIIELIQYNNPHLSLEEAEELMWEWNNEGVN